MPEEAPQTIAVRPVRPRSMCGSVDAAVFSAGEGDGAVSPLAGHSPKPQLRSRTPTTSRTAAAEARSIFFSSAVSLSRTISSTPAAPSTTGTPM